MWVLLLGGGVHDCRIAGFVPGFLPTMLLVWTCRVWMSYRRTGMGNAMYRQSCGLLLWACVVFRARVFVAYASLRVRSGVSCRGLLRIRASGWMR